MIDRRSLLKYAGLMPLIGAVPRLARAGGEEGAEKADYTLRIAAGRVELAPGHVVPTTLYNGQFPGPLLRFKEGQRAVVDVHNDTDTQELVHWHGQMIPSDVDSVAVANMTNFYLPRFVDAPTHGFHAEKLRIEANGPVQVGDWKHRVMDAEAEVVDEAFTTHGNLLSCHASALHWGR
jgi:hypothetical protein